MEQNAQEEENHVDDVQVQVKALGGKVIDDVGKAQQKSDGPQDLAVLHLFGGGAHCISTLFLVHQPGGVHDDGVLGIRVHGIVDKGHQEEDDGHHDQVGRMQNGIGDGGGVEDAQDLGTALCGHLQGDGAGETRVPDHEAGVGGGDQKWIVHVTNPAGHFFGQEGAGDEAEAPVEPAADGGDEGSDQDGALFVLGDRGNGPQKTLADLGGGHGGAEDQHQGHLHGERQQAPEALGITPGVDQLKGGLLCPDHGPHKGHNGQDDGEQEGIRQPSIDYAYAAVCEFLEHTIPPNLPN